jgi:hypothetical protein
MTALAHEVACAMDSALVVYIEIEIEYYLYVVMLLDYYIYVLMLPYT